jgi:hypothetical protein
MPFFDSVRSILAFNYPTGAPHLSSDFKPSSLSSTRSFHVDGSIRLWAKEFSLPVVRMDYSVGTGRKSGLLIPATTTRLHIPYLLLSVVW